MSKKVLNDWFNSLDSYELSFIFPGMYEDYMESAEPGDDINAFIKEAKATWKEMSKEEKEEIYNNYKD